MNGPLRFLLPAALGLFLSARAGCAASAPSADASSYGSDAAAIGGMGTVLVASADQAETSTEAAQPAQRVGASTPASDDAAQSDPAVLAGMATAASASVGNETYNPDPGASRKPIQAPFYQTPPGTPPDYGGERDPLLDTPHAPLLDIPTVKKDWQNRQFSLGNYPPGTAGGLDRWYLPIPQWQRYNNVDIESPYMDANSPQLWDPYKQSILKGDTPVLGQDIFFAMTATSFTSYEARDVPTPAGVSTAAANSSEFYGEGDQMEVDQFFTLSPRLVQGRDGLPARDMGSPPAAGLQHQLHAGARKRHPQRRPTR